MIQLFKVRVNPNADRVINQTVQSGYLGQGKIVDLFEKKLNKHLKTKCLTVNSGTSALDLALHLCEVEPFTEVISTAQTCFASNSNIINRKARIRFADVDMFTGLIDPNSVEKLITKKTRAIMAVDWAGRACDYDKLKSFGIPVIEDAAHCWDTLYKGNPISTHGGDYVCYSLQAIKFLTAADGGILITPQDKYEEAILARWYGLDRRKGESFRCTQNIKPGGHFKYHMNDVLASIGLSNLELASDSVKKHRENADYYYRWINNKNIKLPPYDSGCSYWLYSIIISGGNREDFIKYMADKGIATSPVHFRNDLYDCTKNFREGELPGLNYFSQKQVAIPVGWYLTEEEKNHIVRCINEWVGK